MVIEQDLLKFLKHITKSIETFNKETLELAQKAAESGDIDHELKKAKRNIEKINHLLDSNDELLKYLENEAVIKKLNLSELDLRLINVVVLSGSSDATVELVRQLKVYQALEKINSERNMA